MTSLSITVIRFYCTTLCTERSEERSVDFGCHLWISKRSALCSTCICIWMFTWTRSFVMYEYLPLSVFIPCFVPLSMVIMSLECLS